MIVGDESKPARAFAIRFSHSVCARSDPSETPRLPQPSGEKPLTFDQLIASTDHGILFQTNRSWSIDDKRYNFQFGTEIGWEIKNGKRVRMLKNPSYSGITTEFWNSMDAICSRDEWTLWGTPNCGKGQPQQVMGTGHGASPARFRKVKVGSAYKGT